MFVQTLRGSASQWYASLSPNLIFSWHELEFFFLSQFNPFKRSEDVLIQFTNVKRVSGESTAQFNNIFLLMYQRIQSTSRVIDAIFLKGHYFWGIGTTFVAKIKSFGEVNDVH